MQSNKLKALFEPASVAVIGASSSPSKLGYAVLKNLVEGGYTQRGVVFPINPTAKEILGCPAYPSVLDVPDPIDLAVILVPHPHVPSVLRACGQKGIPAAIVISAGFRESGMKGVEREHELVAIAREFNIRIVGPNCLGVIDTFTPLNASFAAVTPPRGPMAFMSQSGALGAAILDWAQAGRLGLSKFVSLGNKADVNEIDLLRAWADDKHTRVILIYSEELANGQEFIHTAREVTRLKPVIAIKSGVTPSGVRAVSSHTGSLAGSEQAYHAAFRQAGVLQASSLESLFDIALGIGYQPLLQGDRIAIVTNAGGPGILAADALERAGLTLARFELETIKTLKQHLSDTASAANPVDVLGDASPDRYRFALETVIADPNVDGLLAMLVPLAALDVKAMAEAVAALSDETQKPVLACFMGETLMADGIDILRSHDVPNYSFPEPAASVFRAMAEYRDIRARPIPESVKFEVNRAATRMVIDQAWAEGRVAIGDAEARAILESYGLRIPESALADTPERAIELAGQIGYPVVLKIASPDILHKTDVGGVKVGLRSAEEVRDAFELMVYRARRYLPEAQLWGCLVQKMVPPGGLEVLVGMNRDPQFGPLVTFGLGGIYIEVLKDITSRIAPFSPHEAEAMLGEIRAHALLDGVRGQPQADKDAIVDALLRVGQLVQDFPEIVELDINPLVVYPKGQGAIAIDMRLVVAKEIRTGKQP
ncbi:MAG: acetate--CoA ligase family protein [Anaerolineae bacterium]|nr:acetate--CoA ligase family protein [Anaerolineae bacterium]